MANDNSSFLLLSEEDQQLLGEVEEESISPKVWQYAEHPRNIGELPKPDGQSELTGICEDTISFQLSLKDNTIADIRFQARGCGFTLACGSMVTELVLGKRISEALGITGKQIETALGGLPKSHLHCADLSANALKAAARDALENLRNPWKRAYSK
jgi:nitrogen fixation protein NifU and related proteins